MSRARHAVPPKRGGLDRRFHTLWGASAASNLGDGIWLVAAPLLAATLTRDPTLIAGLAFAQRLPWLLFGLIGGALADRLDRRRTMVVVALLRASLVGVLGLAVLFDWASMPLLYVVFFLIATGETLFDTSALALLPAVVPREPLPKANARLGGTWTVTNQFVGPPLGGLLYSVAAGLPFLVGAGGLCAAAGLLSTLRGSFRPERADDAPRHTLRAEIGEGLQWLWSQPLLRTISLAMGVLNLTLVAQVAIMVLYAEERLGLGPGGYGFLITAYGVGGVAGSLIAERILLRTGESGYLRLAIVFEAAAPAALALATDAVLAGAILVLFGLHAMVWGVFLTSLRQELTPDRLRGRVGSVHALDRVWDGGTGCLARWAAGEAFRPHRSVLGGSGGGGGVATVRLGRVLDGIDRGGETRGRDKRLAQPLAQPLQRLPAHGVDVLLRLVHLGEGSRGADGLEDWVPAKSASPSWPRDDDAGNFAGHHFDRLAVAVGNRRNGTGAAIRTGWDQIADPLRADRGEEPANEGAGESVQGVEIESGVLDEDRPPGVRKRGQRLLAHHLRDVEGLDLRHVEIELLDRRAEDRFHLAHLAGVARDEEETVVHRDSLMKRKGAAAV